MPAKRLQAPDAYRLSKCLFIQQEITFKTLGIDKVPEKVNKMKDD